MTMYLYTKVFMTFTRIVQWLVYFIWNLQSDLEIFCEVETRVAQDANLTAMIGSFQNKESIEWSFCVLLGPNSSKWPSSDSTLTSIVCLFQIVVNTIHHFTTLKVSANSWKTLWFSVENC